MPCDPAPAHGRRDAGGAILPAVDETRECWYDVEDPPPPAVTKWEPDTTSHVLTVALLMLVVGFVTGMGMPCAPLCDEAGG